MKRSIFLSMTLAGALAANQSFSVDELRPLSLEELMNVTVTAVSRRAENQNMAPGVVSVISQKEIQQYGARHLRDVLDRVVGTQIIGSHQDYHSKTSMRGFNSSHHEGHVLILLNGRPVRQATDGGLNSDFYLGFPLNVVEHIEIIRGPGSVIYGTNAVTGVINIVTKNTQNANNQTQVDIGGGSFSRFQTQVSTLVGDEDYSLNVGANFVTADGDTFSNVKDQDGQLGDYTWGQKSKNIVANGSYKDLTFSGMVMHNDLDSANSFFQLPTTDIHLQRYFVDFGYTHEIASGWDASINYTYQEDSAIWQINEAVLNNESNAKSNLVEAIVRGKLGDDINLLFGGIHNDVASRFAFVHPATGRLTLPPSDTGYSSLYAQADYMLNDKQKLIAGVQWNKPDGLDADLSPRLGFIQQFGDDTWVKLLYSQAFRSPTFVETSLDAPALRGNSQLSPEEVETFDIQFIHQTAEASFALALYHSKLDNQIVRTNATPPSHENRGHTTFKGIELESRYDVSDATQFIFNASYQENKTDTGIEQSTFAPETMVKLGFTYSGIDNVTFSAFNQYIGESTDLGKVTGNPAININKKADAYNLLTANMVANISSMLGLTQQRKALVSVYLDNLLDEEIYSADLNYANQNNTIPHHWGRGAYGTFTYKF